MVGASQTDPVSVVAFGGGTGMSCLLSGLREEFENITAIVAVTDNGGSSGRLRKEFDMVAPGDIRNCLLALSEGEPILTRLLQHRFDEPELRGHSFGNLMIAALTKVTGSFDTAVREMNRILHVRGQVLPATGQKVSLIATHPDGTKSTGEVAVSASGKPIEKLEMRPRVEEPAPDVARAIERADLLVFGPGSLFTSVIPSLLVEGIRRRVLESSAQKVYIANVMTQAGETTGFDLDGHLDALERHAGRSFITGVIAHTGAFPDGMLERYAAQGCVPVTGVLSRGDGDHELVVDDILDWESDTARHAPAHLTRVLVEHFLGAARRRIA